MDLHRKKLLFRSSRRGMKELDILLGEYARERIDSMSDADLSVWQKLCEINDQDLLRALVENKKINTKDPKIISCLEQVRSYWDKKSKTI